MSRARPVILVTGARGQVGYEVVRAFAPLGHVVAPARSELDLANPSAVRDAVRAFRPGIVVNAGAYTAVDRAESESALCEVVNAVTPGVLAEEASRLDALLVHYSTDYVFDGRKATPYVEDDDPAPLNVYGASKLAGERAIATVAGQHLIFRTSWVYGARGSNFLRTMLRLAREKRELRVVSDQLGAPTWCRDIAGVAALAVRALTGSEGTNAMSSGVYHLTAGGETSWYEFTRALLAADPRASEQVVEHVTPISSAEFPTAARRPARSTLDNGKLSRALGLAVPDWRDQLALMMADTE